MSDNNNQSEFDPEAYFKSIVESAKDEQPKSNQSNKTDDKPISSHTSGFVNRENGHSAHQGALAAAVKQAIGKGDGKMAVINGEVREAASKLIELCDKHGLTSLFTVHANVDGEDEVRTIYSTGDEKPPAHIIKAMCLVSNQFKESLEKFRKENGITEEE